MKSFACAILLAALVAAEPPLLRQQYRFQRQELENPEATTQRGDDPPYPPAGFTPSREFTLPSRLDVSPPSTSYGVPDDSYRAPLRTYVAPQIAYGVPAQIPDTDYGLPEQADEQSKDENNDGEEQNTEDLNVEGENENLEEGPKTEEEVVSNQGTYYVLLPNSQLQRVQFQTENDLRNMAYTARLQYRDEERAPVYVYNAPPQYPSQAYAQLW